MVIFPEANQHAGCLGWCATSCCTEFLLPDLHLEPSAWLVWWGRSAWSSLTSLWLVAGFREECKSKVGLWWEFYQSIFSASGNLHPCFPEAGLFLHLSSVALSWLFIHKLSRSPLCRCSPSQSSLASSKYVLLTEGWRWHFSGRILHTQNALDEKKVGVLVGWLVFFPSRCFSSIIDQKQSAGKALVLSQTSYVPWGAHWLALGCWLLEHAMGQEPAMGRTGTHAGTVKTGSCCCWCGEPTNLFKQQKGTQRRTGMCGQAHG